MNILRKFFKKLFSIAGLEIKRLSRKEKDFLLYLTRGNMARLFYFKRMFDKISSVDGDIVECGIGKAKSFQMLALLVQNEGRGRKLWGFDSFEGFPEPTPEDISPRNPKKSEWSKMARNQVYQTISLIGLDDQFISSRLEIVKGFFEQTLATSKVSKIALLHLDVDLYQSYKVCLEQLFPRVVKGGIVLFDEYMNKDEYIKFPGAKKAIDEYFKNTDYKISRDPTYGKYYLVKE